METGCGCEGISNLDNLVFHLQFGDSDQVVSLHHDVVPDELEVINPQLSLFYLESIFVDNSLPHDFQILGKRLIEGEVFIIPLIWHDTCILH